MSSIFIYLSILFLLMGLWGYFAHKSSLWHYVDVIYYPLAAIGVALLFISSAAQRSLLLVEEHLEQHKTAAMALERAIPKLELVPSRELVDASFGLVSQISELSGICDKIPRMDSQCRVAQNVSKAAAELDAVAKSSYENVELRLAAACQAAEKFVSNLQTGEYFSSFIGSELAFHIQQASEKNYSWLNYESVNQEAETFERQAFSRLAELRKAFKDESEAAKFVFSVNEEEIKTGKTIIHALFPCIVVSKDGLNRFSKWSSSRQSQVSALQSLEEQRKN